MEDCSDPVPHPLSCCYRVLVWVENYLKDLSSLHLDLVDEWSGCVEPCYTPCCSDDVSNSRSLEQLDVRGSDHRLSLDQKCGQNELARTWHPETRWSSLVRCCCLA